MMTEIIEIRKDSIDGEPVTTTLAIATGTENDHASVIRLVRTYLADMEEFGRVGFEIAPFETAGGMQHREIAILNEQQSTLLLTYMRNSDIVRAFKKSLVKAFYEARSARPSIPKTMAEALRLAADQAEHIEQLAAERDQAVATKAQIGSKREATAMATAAKAKREADQLRDELGHNERHATIIAVERATGQEFAKNAYVALRRWCKQYGIKATEVTDPRYGTVKAWPAGAWDAVFGIDLGDLFGRSA